MYIHIHIHIDIHIYVYMCKYVCICIPVGPSSGPRGGGLFPTSEAPLYQLAGLHVLDACRMRDSLLSK